MVNPRQPVRPDNCFLLSNILIDNTIKQLKIDDKALKLCLDNPAQWAAIEKDIVLGNGLEINGTPTFVVGIIEDRQLINYQQFNGIQTV